nr:hypothetical protein [Tanacetum cinerariifolium]
MATTIGQQVALDEALVPSAQRNSGPQLRFINTPIDSKWTPEKEILEFLRGLGHSAQIKTLTDVNKPSIPRRNRVNWHYVRDDILFSTIKVVSRHQNTQQYDVILPIELTIENIRNTKAYKEYYACATREVAPKPKASARKKKGGSASSTTSPTPIATLTPTTTVVAAPRLSAVAKGVLDVPSDDLEEELSWNSFDDEDVDAQTKGRDESEGEKTDESDDDQDEAEKVKMMMRKKYPRLVNKRLQRVMRVMKKQLKDDENNEEDQGLRIGKEERMQEEEEADELYRDVDINQGRGLQVSQDIEDSHVTLTPTHSDGQQESSSTSSFMTNLLNPIIEPGMESIFTTGSSIVTPIPSPQSTMTPSIISTFTTASQLPTPPTPIPSLDLQSLPTFASVFCFEDRVRFLEDNFSNIPGIVNQYMHQQMPEAVREAVQTQTDRLQDFIHRENDEFLKTIDDNMKKIIKEEDARMMMIRKDLPLDQTEGQRDKEKARSMHQPTLHLNQLPGVQAGAKDQPIIQTTQHPEWFSQPRRPPTPDRDWNITLPAAQGNSQSWISVLAKQTDARSSFNELLDTPIDFSNFIMNRLGVDTLTPELLAVNRESALDVYSKRRIIAVIELKIMEWQNYKHLDWITLGVESYQKRLNLTKPDTYRSNLKRREAYTAYSNPIGFIYQNKDKKNRFMRIDELHKFSDMTLNDVRNTLDDRLKGIRMQYLPTTIWRKGDKDRATAMIQAIDKMLKTKRIMRSLERFVGGRQYEGDFRMLQRTI